MKPNSDSIIYATGSTPDGTVLIGGVWTLWDQEGFPLEMSHLLCQQKGWAVDWLEAMADASRTHNLPSLMDHVQTFLPDHVVERLREGFLLVLKTKAYEQIVEEKRTNGHAFEEFMQSSPSGVSP